MGNEDYGKLLSPTCIREFAELEYYMCLGCNDKQPDYVKEDKATGKKTINVCESFADKLWTENPRVYDSCGLNIKKVYPGAQQVPDGFVLPSRYYNNASEFLNVVKPPFFDGFDINIVPKSDTKTKCLNSSASRLASSLFIMLVVAMMNLL